MEIIKNQVLNYINDCSDLVELVAILELSANKSGVLTISEMARKEGKSPNGINQSKKYRKLVLGSQKMCIKGLDDNNLPF